MKENNFNSSLDISGKDDKFSLENDNIIFSGEQNQYNQDKTHKIKKEPNYFQNENSFTNKEDAFVAASDNASVRKEPLTNFNSDVVSNNNADLDKLINKGSISFREGGKIKSKLSRSILNSNFSTKVSDYDACNLKGSGIIGYSKTPNINHKRPRKEDEELLVNPNNRIYTEEDDFKISQFQNNNYFDNNNNLREYNLRRTFDSKTYNIKNKIKTIRDSNRSTENVQRNTDDMNLESTHQNMEVGSSASASSSPTRSKILEQNENSKQNNQATNSNICFNNNSFGEKIVDIQKEVKTPKSMKIYFSVYFPPNLIQLVLGESKEKYSNPLVFKILLPVKSNETFNPIMQRFINELNINLKEHSLRLMDIEEAIKYKNGSLKNLEEQTIYLPKCMKNSGKPDFDLPGFDLRIILEDINVNRFALAYEPFCLVSLLKQSSKNVNLYISSNNIIEDATEDESSSSCVSNSIKYNNKIQKSLCKIKEKEQLEEEENNNEKEENTKEIIVHENQQINCCGNETQTEINKTKTTNGTKKGRKGSSDKSSKVNKKESKCCDGCLIF